MANDEQERSGALPATAPANAASAAGTDAEAEGAQGLRWEGDAALAPDGTVFGHRFRQGLYHRGTTPLEAFLQDPAQAPAGLAPSVQRVLAAVSQNEGRLEAINTWDAAFLSFGFLQWTAGTGSAPGELPALLARLQQMDGAAFERCFGRYGLAVDVLPPADGAPPRGFLVLDSEGLVTPAAKARLRSLPWAHRFWRAGHDDAVRRAQLAHAAARIPLFHRDPQRGLRGRPLAAYVRSEWGVALLLDEHVNRPAHVPGTLAQALARLERRLDADRPERWADAEEHALLAAYLEQRGRTGLTDPHGRAARIRARVDAGLLSVRRGSYDDGTPG